MKYVISPYSIHELGQRQNQEDSLFPAHGAAQPSDRLFILCDGMGGHEHGEVASATVCEAISQTILSRWNANEPLSDDLLQQAIDAAYDALDAKDDNAEKKMGTTLTLLCLHADGATVAHIGDSRVYQFRPATKGSSARILFRTRDHTLVSDLVRIGEITEEEAKTHPQKNVITRAMQPHQSRRAKADIAHLTDIRPGDYFFLCSDGMLEQTSDDELTTFVTKTDLSNKEKVEGLLTLTEENKDNHTAHLIYINKVEGVSAMVNPSNSCNVPKPVAPIQGTPINVDSPTRKRSHLGYIITGVALLLVLLAAVAITIGRWFGTKDERVKKADTVIVIREVNHHVDTAKKQAQPARKDPALRNHPRIQDTKPSIKPEEKSSTAPKQSKPEVKEKVKEKETAPTDAKKNNNKQEDTHATTTDTRNDPSWRHI